MTDNRFQAALNKINRSITIPQELMARGIYDETVEALTLAARHAELEFAIREMECALEAIAEREEERIKRDRRINPNGLTENSIYVIASEAVAVYRKMKEAGG